MADLGVVGQAPFVTKKDLDVYVPTPRVYRVPPPPPFDLAKYASNASRPPIPPYIIGSSLRANTDGFPAGYKMEGADVALVLNSVGFTGKDLLGMVGIWYRESGNYCHQVVWRPSTGDYSFGAGGFNMINDMGADRRRKLSNLMGRPIANLDLLDPYVNARACKWLFDAGARYNGDGFYHWGGYKEGETGLTGVDFIRAQAAIDAAFPKVVPPVNPDATYFQKVMNWLVVTDHEGRALRVDGQYGPRSKAACAKYQTSENIPVTGVVDRQTWDRIDLAVLRDLAK